MLASLGALGSADYAQIADPLLAREDLHGRCRAGGAPRLVVGTPAALAGGRGRRR